MGFSRDGKPFSLDPKDRSFFGAPTHSGVPVLDQDINIQQRIQAERLKDLQQALVTDGWATRGDFAEVGGGSLYLIMGNSKAIVDGSVLQVKEFFTSDNRISFAAANPASGRYDLVWFEVWYELVGSTDTIYKYGNVNYYGSGLTNDLIDTTIGSITSSRVQVRYRIRVTPNASAMSSATVLAQGAMASPGAGKTFTEDTEKKHWYCNTGTDYSIVGGYVYALPIVKVWRAAGDDAVNLGDLTDQRVLGVVNTDVILTTQGDLIVKGSSEVERLAAGVVGTILKGKGGGVLPAYEAPTLAEVDVTATPGEVNTACDGILATASEINQACDLTSNGFFTTGNVNKMLFYLDTAPTGWSIDTALNDKLVFVTKGSGAGGQTGGAAHSAGSWTISGLTADVHKHKTTIFDAGTVIGHRSDQSFDTYQETTTLRATGTLTDSGSELWTFEYTDIASANGVTHTPGWRPAAYSCIMASLD